MNIPENTLQQVADAAFAAPKSQLLGEHFYASDRRAIIQHALDNPALAPFLAGVGGEYTDEELAHAGNAAWESKNYFGLPWLRSFLAALPRRESPALAEAIARAEKAEAELSELRFDKYMYSRVTEALGIEKDIIGHVKALKQELSSLKSAQLGILRPISEMPETVPDGCVMVFGSSDSNGVWDISDVLSSAVDTDFAILRLPAAEPIPPAEPEPAAQVPLGPEDVKPGSVIRYKNPESDGWELVTSLGPADAWIGGRAFSWERLMKEWQINTSLPDTGRWDANAWRPCSKPGKEVAK